MQWRPSAWLSGACLLLGVLAGCAILASELPPPLAWPLALAALVHGLRLYRRESRRRPRSFVLRGDVAAVSIDGEPVDEFVLDWRGPLAFARWRDQAGRRHRCSWWPDTLPPARRRELRLAAPAGPAAPRRASMAP